MGTGELAVNEEVVRRHHGDLFGSNSSRPRVPSRARTVGLVVLRAYLLLAAAAVIAKLIGLIGHT